MKPFVENNHLNRWFAYLACLAFTFIAGSVFGQTLTTLVSFNGTNGYGPSIGFAKDLDGNFFGTTAQGGDLTLNDGYGYGTVFKLTSAGALTTLVSFNGRNGNNPFGLLRGFAGNFYGTTVGGVTGDPNDVGTVFKITPSGILFTLVTFTGSFIGPNGSTPTGLLQGRDGCFYGTTLTGGLAGNGTIFKMTASGILTTLFVFDNTNGALPFGGLVQGNDGNFYGTTAGSSSFGGSEEGPTAFGTVFKMTPAGELTTLIYFNQTNGAGPLSSLVQGSDGNFYGTTSAGGDLSANGFGNGTVFQITPSGKLKTLVLFNGINGAGPQGPLMQGSDGVFYGTTSEGGDLSANDGVGDGTVFQITPSGKLKTLVLFNGINGAFIGGSQAALIQGPDGNIFGTTYAGGANGVGTAFKLIFTPPAVAVPPATRFTWIGSNAAFTVTASGDALSYQWRLNGQNIIGATDASLLVTNASTSDEGNYSVVVRNPTGSVTSDHATLLLPPGNYSGLFYETNGVTEDSSGYFTITLAKSWEFTGRVYINGLDFPLSGKFSTNRFLAHINVIRTNQPTNLSIDMQLIEANGSAQIIGTVSDGVWMASLVGDRSYYNEIHNCPQVGNYGVTLFASGDGSHYPNYGSRAVVNVAQNGVITLSGTMGDDSVIAQSANISKDGRWPFYVPLYAKSLTVTNRFERSTTLQYTGELLGWITFTNQTDSRLQGNVSWLKIGAFGKYYSAGFTNDMSAFGSVRK